MKTDSTPRRPLDGLRILEMGQLIAGPFAGCVLGYFGAEVIKVEPPGKGDPLRHWRVLGADGTSLWWRSMARNKRCITLDLRSEAGRDIARQLVLRSDVVLENFRPGTMEKWGLGPEQFTEQHPELIYARVSGYGQTGPYSSRAGFASACEGMGGFRFINGHPGQAPVRPNLSMGDTLAALNAVIGILLGLIERNRVGGKGQMVDIAIYEAVYNILESVVPEYDGADLIRQPSGTTLTGIVPTNTYPCLDNRHVVIGGNGDSIFKRLMQAIGRDDLGADPRLSDNAGRVSQQREVDDAIAQWTCQYSVEEVLIALEQAGVPAGPIYNVKDMLEDPHYQARHMFEEVDVAGKPLKIPAITPVLEDTPGHSDWAGPALGAHNREIYQGLLEIDDARLAELESQGII